MKREEKFMAEAIALSTKGISKKGGPFGCIIVKGEKIVGSGYNKVTLNCDPTAHAEIIAIRDACANLGTFQLEDCEVYSSCEPCPMCMGAIYWARPKVVYYANSRHDAASIGFDDSFIYEELNSKLTERKIPFISLKMDNAVTVFKDWKEMENKIAY